jgi:tRNA dimethylallyltransferase
MNDIITDVKLKSDNAIRSIAKKVRAEYQLNNNVNLNDLLEGELDSGEIYQICEINVVGPDGKIAKSTDESIIDFDFADENLSTQQPQQFLKLLGDTEEVIQDFMKNAKGELRKYAGLKLADQNGFIQVAYNKDQFRKKIDEFWENSLVPIMVGGSGLYIDSVLYDYRFNEDGRNRENEKQYDDLSNEELHKILESLNKESADSIHPNNRKRVLRAIELAQNNSSYEDRTLKNNPVYDFLLIFLNDDRDVLYERINARVDEMFDNGLLEEVTNLYPDKLGEQAKKAIGYSELYAFLDGFISQEEAKNLIKQHSRNYAKRQLTWYRNHKNVNFVNVNVQNLNLTLDEIKKLVDDFLSR